MIVEFSDLPKFSGAVAMVDGSFDPIHDGHIAYFEQAAALGLPLLCNVASDEWTASKHAVLLTQMQRGVVLNAIRYIAYVHLASSSTLEVLKMLRPKIYVKGDDWLKRGGVPHAERDSCAELGIEIKYLDTVHNSSSDLLANWRTSAAKSD
jgi:cytidyltransferase-like protein